MKKIKKTLKSLTIDRDKWGTNALLTHDNKMCCLGFACKNIGYDLEKAAEEADIRFGSFDYPSRIKQLYGSFGGPEWLLDSHWVRFAVEANDRLEGQEREDTIKQLFADNDCKIRFVGGKKPARKTKTKKVARKAKAKPAKQSNSAKQSTSGGSLYRDTGWSKNDKHVGPRGDTW